MEYHVQVGTTSHAWANTQKTVGFLNNVHCHPSACAVASSAMFWYNNVCGLRLLENYLTLVTDNGPPKTTLLKPPFLFSPTPVLTYIFVTVVGDTNNLYL